ncbi:MAG: hypothetical protein Q8P23_00900 [bacterium]|nr:hypothetical protein [bacterium]
MKTLLAGSESTKNILRENAGSDGKKNADGSEDTYVVYWPEGNLVIPWPEGKTAQEAINLWLGLDETTAPNEEPKIDAWIGSTPVRAVPD